MAFSRPVRSDNNVQARPELKVGVGENREIL